MTDRAERRAFLRNAIKAIKHGLTTGDGVAVVAVTRKDGAFAIERRSVVRSNGTRVALALILLEDIRDDASCACDNCQANRAIARDALTRFYDGPDGKVLH